MDFTNLKNALAIVDGKVTIESGKLTPNIDALLKTGYGEQPIVIENAEPGPGGVEGTSIVLQGQSTFLNVDAAVRATFSLDGKGEVQAVLVYTLIGKEPDPNGWRFSKSFPELPKVVDWNQPFVDPLVQPLDDLSLFNACFVVVSQDQMWQGDKDQAAVSLSAGINFVSSLKLGGVVDLVMSLTGETAPLTLFGTVRIPATGEATQPLGALQWPWAVAGGCPGISLRAALTNGRTFDKLSLGSLFFRLYTPLTQKWLNDNSTYRPVLAYTGQLAVPSASLALDLAAEIAIGAGNLLLAGNFTGFSLGNLASLVDLSGSDQLIATMPDQIKTLGDKLGKLQLTHVSLGLSLNEQTSKLEVSSASASIGMPDLNWQVWDGHFKIDSLDSRFEIDAPFDSKNRKISVFLEGRTEVEGVPIDISAESTEAFTVYARLGEKQTIPLRQLMQTYVPGVPAPSDLTIDALALSVNPGKSYSMSAAMAQQPNPWTIPLGPTTLTVSDLTLAFTYPKGGPLGGSFSGTIALGSAATMSMTYTIPGSLTLNADLPHISLSGLARTVANATSLPLPSGFPEIDLIDSTVVMARQSTDSAATYSFKLQTTVTVGGTAGLNFGAILAKTESGTGFAVGIWTPKWAAGKGWSPGSLWQPLQVLEIDSAGLVVSTLPAENSVKNQLIPLDQIPALAQDKFKIVSGVTFFATLYLTSGPVAILSELFGNQTTFSLYAAFASADKALTLIAHLESGAKNAFVFDSFDLAWESVGTTTAAISITAGGHLSIEGENLDYSVTGKVSVDTLGASVRLALNVRDWVHPFGYDRLIVNNFGIAVALDTTGAVIALQGTFQFSTKKQKSFLFGVAGAILNFEAPSALAFQLKSTSPNQMLKLGEILEGITTIDVYDLPPGVNVAPWILEIKLIDLFLQIAELSFWAVIADEVEIGGITYKKGFGLRGFIALFGIKVRIYLEVRQADKMFAGSAEFPDEIRLGGVLVLSRPSTIPIDSKADLATSGAPAPTPAGPALAVSSAIDSTHPYYLFVAAHVELFDIIKADILGQANNDGIAFLFDLKAGTSGQGAWGAQRITVLVSREQMAFGASLAYDFGLKNVTLGGFDLFGAVPIPSISLPDFRIGVSGKVSAGLLPPKFGLGGSLTFEFMGISLNPSFDISVSLENAPQKLADFGALLLTWIKEHLEDLLKTVFDAAQKFADWVKQNFEYFKNLATQVAQAIRDQWNNLSSDAVKALMTGIGWAADVVAEAVDTAFKICASTQALMALK